MSEFKGTPGPWFVDDGGDVGSRSGRKDGTRDMVAGVAGCEWSEEDAANANLIAAAPELLEALQEMVAIVKKNTYPQPDKPNSTWGRMEAAEAVIKKALGQ